MNLSTDPPAQPRPLKLLADGMLGRLARWLRAMGYDTLYAPAADDSELIYRARAQGRVLLTADRALASRRGARILLIQAQDPVSQVRLVYAALGPPPGEPFSRCVACNGELSRVDKSTLAGHVPPYILATQQEFRRCPDCRRIYWPGSHVQRMRAMIGRQWQAVDPTHPLNGDG